MSLTILHRSFSADVELGSDRRTLVGRLVPYNEVADVADVLDGKLDRYREGFRPGVFARQAGTSEPGNIKRIGLHHRHERGLGYLGQLISLDDRDDGLHGTFSLLSSKAGDVAELVEDGVHGLSIEFRAMRSAEEDGVRWRTSAILDDVALEPVGAYASAQVLALRAAAEEAEEAEQVETQRLDRAAELDAFLAAEQERRRELEERFATAT